mgnify:CR=1 FL=1
MKLQIKPKFNIRIELGELTVRYIVINNDRYYAASSEIIKNSPEEFIVNPSEDQKEYLAEKLRKYLAITRIRASKLNPRTRRYDLVTTLPVIVLQHLHNNGFSRETQTQIIPEKGFRISQFEYLPRELLERKGYYVEEHRHPGLKYLEQIRSCRLFFEEGGERKTELYTLNNVHNCSEHSWNTLWSKHLKELT